MRRDSVRSVLEHLSIELNDEERLLERLERGWKDLENDIFIILERKEKEVEELNYFNKIEENEEKSIDFSKLCSMAKAVVRFAETIGLFRLLPIDYQAQILKVINRFFFNFLFYSSFVYRFYVNYL